MPAASTLCLATDPTRRREWREYDWSLSGGGFTVPLPFTHELSDLQRVILGLGALVSLYNVDSFCPEGLLAEPFQVMKVKLAQPWEVVRTMLAGVLTCHLPTKSSRGSRGLGVSQH